MLNNAKQIVDILLNPSLLLSMPLAQQSDLMIVLRHQKIIARFAYLTKQYDVFDKLHEKTQRHLKNALKIAEKQKEQVQLEASLISNLLKNESKFVVFLKGAAYTLSDTLVGKGRVYSDIDILVNKAELKSCEQTLAFDGWLGQEISNYDDKYYRKWAHEIPPLEHCERGTIIDVHHNIIPIISQDAPTVEALTSFIQTNKQGIQTLTPAAQFVHSAVHLFRNEDYNNAFRDISDLYLMLLNENGNEVNENFLLDVQKVADDLTFNYEVGLAYSLVSQIFSLNIPKNFIERNLNKSRLRTAFDQFIFKDVLLPQHDLLPGSHTPFKHFLAIIRGHFIKMPFALLCYHLIVKLGRSIIEMIFGKHIFTPKDEMTLDNIEQNKAHKN